MEEEEMKTEPLEEERKPIIRRITEGITEWCADNSPAAKLERTVAQGAIGVASAALAAVAGAPEWVQQVIIPTVMVVFTALQAQIGAANNNENKEN